MSMMMKQLMNSILFIFCVWTCLRLSVVASRDVVWSRYWGTENYRNGSKDASRDVVWIYCGTENYTNDSNLQDRDQLLDSLADSVSLNGFSNSTVQNSSITVYGLVQCRGDLGSSDCEVCAWKAKAMLAEQCDWRTSGFIQLDGCFLRYNSSSFYNHSSYSSLNFHICNYLKNNQPEQFSNAVNVLLSNVTTKAAQSPKRFAADSVVEESSPSSQIYSIAQCSRDMSQTICRACLAYPLPSIFALWCEMGALGAQFISSDCQLRFEVYNFFNSSILVPPTLPRDNIQPSSGKTGSILSSPPPVSSENKRSNVLQITLGVVAAVVGLIAVIGLCKWNFVSRTSRPEIGEKGKIILCPTIANLELIFKYDVLREATSNFKEENKLGQGAFGSVFKGDLPDGRVVAVKRLNIGSSQGDAEFLNEANLISLIQHRNLVKLLGCSFERSERLLVYEYLPNSSLDKILFDTRKSHLLGWNERYEIIVGTARGLAYLHEESEIRIIHRDIKASNILLDNKDRPKIADFGLAKFFPENQTHVSTGIAGTIGYMAPEYALRGQLTEKADVFSFGVLLLEIVSGRKNQSLAPGTEFLIEGAWRLYKADRGLEIIDPTLKGRYLWEEVIRVIKIGLLCTQASAALRPSMSRVVSMLTTEREHLPSPTRPTFIDPDNMGIADRTSSITASSSSDIHSAAADPSSGILEPR